MNVEQNDVRPLSRDHLDRLEHVAGLSDDGHAPASSVRTPAQHELVVVDHDDATHHVPSGRRSPTSVPSPGDDVTAAVPPRRSIRPTTDSRSPAPVRRHRLGRETSTRVADVHAETVGPRLGVDVDAVGFGVPRGVDDGLAHGAHRLDHTRAGRCATTDDHELDRDAMALLDLGADVLEHRSYSACAPIAIRAVEPRPQLPLLPRATRRGSDGIAAGALDERERLEDGVVEVRGDARTLLRADALPPLSNEVARAPRSRGPRRGRGLPRPRPGAGRRRGRRPGRR